MRSDAVPPCKDLQGLEFGKLHALPLRSDPTSPLLWSAGPSQLIFPLATSMIFTILNYSHGLDLFLMLETDPWVENFHSKVKDQRDMSSLLPPLPGAVEVTSPLRGQWRRGEPDLS